VGGALFGAMRLIRKKFTPEDGSLAPRIMDLPALALLIRQPAMLMACVANVAMTLSMTGAIFTYFPIYARAAGISTVTIGSLYAWRSIASASGRVPMGPLSARLPAHWTLAAVLVVEAGIDVAISRSVSPLVLAALLILEGIGFGVFLVSGQSAVSEAAGQSNRGAAVGLFWMAGSLGDLFGPIILGVIAQAMGLIAVFQVTAGAVVVGAGLVVGLGAMAAKRSHREAAPVT
jgi:predicted MFS family arabinose efflux permease